MKYLCQRSCMLFLLLCLPLFCWSAELKVAVSSSLMPALPELSQQFQQQYRHKLILTQDASGNLAKRINKGEAFDVFLSANESWPRKLVSSGLGLADHRVIFAQGRLVLWSPQVGLVDNRGRVLTRNVFEKLAIANDLESAYGAASRETLTKLILWNQLRSRLLRKHTVSEVFGSLHSEQAQLGFLPLSLLMKNGEISQGSWWVVPLNNHQPIRHTALVLKKSSQTAAAQQLLLFLKSEAAQQILAKYGFERPN